jgi:hypothetical protein
VHFPYQEGTLVTRALRVTHNKQYPFINNILTYSIGPQIFQKSMRNLKIPDVRRVKSSRFYTEDTQVLGPIVQNLVARELCTLRYCNLLINFVFIFLFSRYLKFEALASDSYLQSAYIMTLFQCLFSWYTHIFCLVFTSIKNGTVSSLAFNRRNSYRYWFYFAGTMYRSVLAFSKQFVRHRTTAYTIIPHKTVFTLYFRSLLMQSLHFASVQSVKLRGVFPCPHQ